MLTNLRLTTTGTQTLYTSNGDNAITAIIVCNTNPINLTDETDGAARLTVFACPSGIDPDTGSAFGAGPKTTIISQLNIPAGETVFFSEERLVLENLARIIVQADTANALSITISTLAV